MTLIPDIYELSYFNPQQLVSAYKATRDGHYGQPSRQVYYVKLTKGNDVEISSDMFNKLTKQTEPPISADTKEEKST